MLPSPPPASIATATGPFHEDGVAYFIFEGQAEEVRLRTFMPRFPPHGTFIRWGDRWFLPLPLPATARIEYRLGVRNGHRWLEMPDPLNPTTAANPFGTNSVFTGPEYRPTSIPLASDSARGEVVEVRVASAALEGRRHHHVYLPPGFRPRHEVAVLFIHDGDDFARYGGLLEILDGLIDSARIPPLVAVLLDPWRRLDEYTASPRHGVHVTDEVLPHLRRRLGVSGPARSRGLVGASLGAVAALATACQYPEAYGRLGLISGTFVRRPGPEWPEEVFAPVFTLIASVASEPRLEGYRIFMSTGRYESLIDHHRHLLPYLRITNNTIRAAETWDGHHWGSWRDRLAEALPFLYPTGDGSTSIP